MFLTIKKEWQAKAVLLFFLVLTGWWLVNQFIIGNQNIPYNTFFDFGEFYGYIALFGGICGLVTAHAWGGHKSIIGKALYMFSFGLFAQEFGQLFLAWYNDLYNKPGPYPSLGDLGFFSTIPLYIAGIYYLATASGVKIRPALFIRKPQSIIIPLGMLGIVYFMFLQGYTFDWSMPIKIFLDLAYPLGDALYISLAILTYMLSRGVLGGLLKNKIRFILFALSVQFIADFTFLYQSSKGTWTVGGINDYMYFLAYFLMTLGLLQFKTVHDHLKAN